MVATIRNNPQIGSVSKRTRQIVELSVNIDAYELGDLDDVDNDTEFQVTLNGAILKRMNPWQLRRILGIADGK